MYLLTRVFLSLISTTADYSRLLPGGTVRTAIPSVVVLISFSLVLVVPAVAGAKRRLRYGLPLILLFLAAYPAATTHSLGRNHTEVCLFSLREGDAAGIRVSGNRAWLVLSSHETMYNRPARDALLPWLGGFPRCRLEGIVVPRASVNLIHDLVPLFRKYDVKRVVTGALPRDPVFREDFDSFLAEYGAPLEELAHGGTVRLCDSTRIEIFDSRKTVEKADEPQWSLVVTGTRLSYPCSVGNKSCEVVLSDGVAKIPGDFGLPDRSPGPINLRELGALTLKSSDSKSIEWFLETKRSWCFP
jgi:hypothetical protein